MTSVKDKRHLLKWLILALLCFFMMGMSVCNYEEPEYYEGVLSFEADYNVVFLPGHTNALYIDTLQFINYEGRIPEWRLIGPLKIDSIRVDKEVQPLHSEWQMEDVLINSPELVEILKEFRVYSLGRVAPSAIPHDTLKWSKVRHQWFVAHDLSRFFEIEFGVDKNIDSIYSLLICVPGLSNVSYEWVPIPDRVGSPLN